MAELERSLQTVVDGEKDETSLSLPDDIIVDILLMSPVKSILRFRCVSKHWYNKLSRHSSFVKLHLENSIGRGKFGCISIKGHHEFSMLIKESSSLTAFGQDDYFEPIDARDLPFESQLVKHPNLRVYTHGSCNGLVLMGSRTVIFEDINLCLWNPNMKELKEIVAAPELKLELPYYHVISRNHATYGLGYNCDTDDYKIVKANVVYGYASSGSDCYGSGVQIYSLRSGSWKPLPNIIPYEIVLSYTRAFVNGALHWIATPCPFSNFRKSMLIVSFDIRCDNFREVPVTTQVNELIETQKYCPRSRMMTLGVLGGCLCLVFSGTLNIEVWVMKDHKLRESWTKLFTGRLPFEKTMLCYLTLKWEFKNGKVLFEAYHGGDTYFVIYDLGHNKSEASEIVHVPGYKCSVETYLESLVSVSGTYAREPELRIIQREPELRIIQKQAVRKQKGVFASYTAGTFLLVAAISLVTCLTFLLMQLF